jgi:hypothetical protein
LAESPDTAEVGGHEHLRKGASFVAGHFWLVEEVTRKFG